MSHFYGVLKGGRGEVTRTATKASGLHTTAAGWGGAIKVRIDHVDGVDRYTVLLTPWQNSGGEVRVLAEGVLNACQ